MPSGKSVVIKYSKSGDLFEIIVDPEMAYEYATGKRADPLSVLEAEDVFKDARKGERQSPEKLRKVFGTDDLGKVVDIILKNSEIPMTAEHRARVLEEKRKQIINIIATNSIDPRTNAPNPPLRIENAMREARVTIDPFKNAPEQVESVISKISFILPIKFTTVKIQVIVPADSANRCYGTLKRYGLKSEEWLSNGSLKATVEFPAGMQNEFFDRINKATHGSVETKIL